MAAALPLFAVAITALRRVRLSGVHQISPERLSPGTRGQVTLIITNSYQTKTPSIEMSEPAVPGLTTGMQYLIAPIPSAGSSRIVYPIYATCRGRFTLGPPHVRIGDPFDLWEDNRTLDVHTEVLVVPTVVPLTGMPRSSGARSAASGRASIGTVGGDPDIGVRPYQYGDDIRTIHWRASARYDELVVRLEEPVSHGSATVLLDYRAVAHRGVGIASSLETAVVLAASISLHLLSADHRVTLVSHRGTVLAQGHDISDDVLAELSVIEPDLNPALAPTTGDRSGLLVAVIGALSVVDAALLAATARSNVNAIAMVLAAQDWNPELGDDGARATVDTLRAGNWRVVVVHPGEDLRTAWLLACNSADGYAAPLPAPAGARAPAAARPIFDRNLR